MKLAPYLSDIECALLQKMFAFSNFILVAKAIMKLLKCKDPSQTPKYNKHHDLLEMIFLVGGCGIHLMSLCMCHVAWTLGLCCEVSENVGYTR